MGKDTNYDYDYLGHQPRVVTVNGCAPAVLIQGVTVNGNRYFSWRLQGRDVFISDTAELAIARMDKAQRDGVTF